MGVREYGRMASGGMCIGGGSREKEGGGGGGEG